MANLEKKIKQAYIDGSNSNNKLIQFYLEQIKGLEAQLKAKDEEIAMFKKHASSLSGYHEFIEQLETFDFDTFGKDDCFDNGDVYQVLQFFAHKIYGVLGKQIEAKDEEIESLSKRLKLVKKLSDTNEKIIAEKDEEIERLKAEIEAQEAKSCEGCGYYHVFTGVCTNDKCPLCADFVDTDFGCIYHKLKETNENM